MSITSQGLPWGTQWDLVAAAEDSVDWSGFLVTLGFQDGRAGGRAPVNRYFGMCAEGSQGSLALGPFGMTMMAGPPGAMAAETAYMRLLEQVQGFRLVDDRLVLLDSQGAELLHYVPSADPE
ncbi:MAG TPA: META domain-containing protein [Candidatus Limnocylindrales bacterium]|nr:META domain-containing protein [Candidatus Limnocylindrales bacterium]